MSRKHKILDGVFHLVARVFDAAMQGFGGGHGDVGRTSGRSGWPHNKD